METTENNKLIAEFMEVDQVHIDTWCEHNNLQYHKSWDCLLPVIREVLILIDINKLDFDTTALKYEVLDNDIKQAYNEVLKFINEYYNQK